MADNAGLRMVEEVARVATEKGASRSQILRKMGLNTCIARNWERRGDVPSAKALKGAVEQGMDVVYILTGKRGQAE